ncbi:hypothetical protein [Arthrobacter nitrophenolicus]|uniref:Uncharacterized protein n=2 Tax=Arthrobacter nitrophenolicus TaxID=683150 RepID=A0ACC6THV2_9MICC|nr:hypothetical protein [Arthrobacter nitrophenolicus]ELT43568.1 hypothetical protein G205_17604 [Arthrobacter nitrophenolicus]
MFKRLLTIIAALAMLLFGFTTPALAATTIDPAAAPTGTHLQTGSIGCTVDDVDLSVTCSEYELAGVGNANAEATLIASYTATVQCRNHGGKIVEVKSQLETVPSTTGKLEPKNGRLTVPSLTSAPVPSDEDFEALATCPNGNWTKEMLEGSVELSSFTYTLHFVGYTGNYITITG